MKSEQVKDYIAALLNNPEVEKEVGEVQNSLLLLNAYKAGLQRKEFPLDLLFKELKIEQAVPAQFHTLVAQIAVLKTGKSPRYVYKNAGKLLQEFANYFITNPKEITRI
jgi:hypothetical protein